MTDEEILESFCATDDSRPLLMLPWSDGEYTYATDAMWEEHGNVNGISRGR